MRSVAIHFEPKIEWQGKRAPQFAKGLTALGLDPFLTCSRERVSDVAILLGTTCWRAVEDTMPWMLVDRASIGDPHYVSLVWNGHGRRGDHKVPPTRISRTPRESRWEALGVELMPRVAPFDKTVICGQTEPYSPHFRTMPEWYDTIIGATHFRSHPTGDNPTGLPTYRGWEANFHVLNSSVAVDAMIRGLPLLVHDEGCMAHGVDDRQEWAHWLAWTQWRWDEIEDGEPIRHLFEDM